MNGSSLSRRHFFFGSLALASACGRHNTAHHHDRAHAVSVLKASSYSVDLFDKVRRVLVDHQVRVAGQRILLKPNLVEFTPRAPINTHPVFVEAVAAAFHSLGAAHVQIAEGPGHRRMTLDMAEGAGYFSAIPQFESHFTDLNLDDVTRVQLKQPLSSLRELYLPNSVLACDLLVSLPKLKTHHWAGATLSMKNLFGVVPGGVYGWPKNVLHWAGIPECIADLNALFPRQFCIVDGIEGMEGNGPILGTPINSGVIVAGAHPPSVDATCCRVMRINPAKIGYLNLVAERDGWNASDITQTGERLRDVSKEFALLPDFSSLRLS